MCLCGLESHNLFQCKYLGEVEAKMEKVVKKYRLKDAKGQEEEDLKYWTSASISKKTEMTYSLWEEHCWIKGVNVNAQRLRRILRITKLPQG